jgi:hypothetical protein
MRFLPRLASGASIDPARIRPRLEIVPSNSWQGDLFRFATYYWRIPISEGYGRRMRFLVWDDHHDALIGIFALGDAVFNLKARDAHIGWDGDRRAEALVNLMDAYALGALPPYNMLLGGKVVASLIRTREVVEAFSAKYHDSVGIISEKSKSAQLVAVTTTSALGRSSIYNRLSLNGTKIFSSIGDTTGWGHFHISEELFSDIREYLRSKKDAYTDSHEYGQGPNYRLRVIRKGLRLIGLDPDIARHGLTREIFYCSLASNSVKYLNGKNKRIRYLDLPTVSEVGAAAVDRWMIGRAERRPEFREWRRESFLLDLGKLRARQMRKHAEAA